MRNKRIRKASLTQRIAIYEFLRDREALAPINEEERVVAYRAGFNDAYVASQISSITGSPTTESMVANVRVEMFGNLKHSGGGYKHDLAEQIKDLAQRVTIIEGTLREIMREYGPGDLE